METETLPVVTETRVQPAAKKAAVKKTAKKKAAAKPAKVKGVLTLPSGKFEVSIFLGAFDRLEEAIAAREQGLALRESIKAAPTPKKKRQPRPTNPFRNISDQSGRAHTARLFVGGP